jgi:bifunctional non-homologous end joining protein LigD
MPTAKTKSIKPPSGQPIKSTARPAGKPELVVQGKRIPVSNLDKVLYPKVGFTKGQVIDYYIRVGPALLPHLKDRPLTLKRYPNGVEAPFFYEKRCPSHRPDWVETAPIWSEGNKDHINFCLANDIATLVWAANLADLELHTYLSQSHNFESPNMIVFDLDPGPPANIIQCAQVALWMKDLFDHLKLRSFPKTSGSKGLQVYIPVNSPTTYQATKTFAKKIAELLEKQYPELVVSKMSKQLRHGKIFVDWSQNDRSKTTVCVYSLRAKERPTVSTPVKWPEIIAALDRKEISLLTFESDEALQRVQEFGDLFAPVLQLKQKVPEI